jgi:glycosyltransferase involved in cell wall biosynthesis
VTAFSTDGISVVIPTHGRIGSLFNVLDGLARQDYPPELFEVVVVLDGPDDGDPRMLDLRDHPFRLHVRQQPRSGPAAARNLGLEQARGPFVLFLDDDVIPATSLLSEHRAAHGSRSDLVVIGTLLAPRARSAPPWTSWEWETLAEQYRAMNDGDWEPTPRQFYTGNASVRKEHLHSVAGFNAEFKRGEDVELAWRLHRLGLSFVFRPSAAGTHLARRPFRAWLDAAYQYGRTDVMLERARTGGAVPGWVLSEFAHRHPGSRRLALAGLEHQWLVGWARLVGGPLLRAVALLAGTSRAHNLCSALFTMTYWSGAAEQLSDRRGVARMLAQTIA